MSIYTPFNAGGCSKHSRARTKTQAPASSLGGLGSTGGGNASLPSPVRHYEGQARRLELADKLTHALGPADHETRSVAISAEDARAIIRELEQ